MSEGEETKKRKRPNKTAKKSSSESDEPKIKKNKTPGIKNFFATVSKVTKK